jgi:hypothetical protein
MCKYQLCSILVLSSLHAPASPVRRGGGHLGEKLSHSIYSAATRNSLVKFEKLFSKVVAVQECTVLFDEDLDSRLRRTPEGKSLLSTTFHLGSDAYTYSLIREELSGRKRLLAIRWLLEVVRGGCIGLPEMSAIDSNRDPQRLTPAQGNYLGGKNSSGYFWWVGWEARGGKAQITEIGVVHK